jgi:hypothetical protein
MDINRLIQGLGGRLLRQALGMLMKKGVQRLSGGAGAKGPVSPADRDRHAQTQKRIEQVMKVGRRFWR